MEDKSIRKETLRKLLGINTDFVKKQNEVIKKHINHITSLEGQLELMIKERNKYKDKYDNSKSLEKQLKESKDSHSKCIIAYAKAIGVLKDKKEVSVNSSQA